MAISGGGDLSHLRPLDPTGNLYTDRVGSHRGEFEHMNVCNPQPGYTYYYEKRKAARIQARMRKGYKVIGPDDPEFKGRSSNANLQGSGLDGLQSHDDVVLMKCPEQLCRQRAKDKVARAEAEITGATAEYLNKGGSDERRYGSPDKPIRFKLPKHRVYSIDAPDQERE